MDWFRFFGGPYDGMKIQVEHFLTEVKLTQLPNNSATVEAEQEASVPAFDDVTYTRERIAESGEIIFVFRGRK